ncbi:hypothetical protein BDV95DRAFT_594251 [Massariosphaeria phaeospora]|uniref:Uncharacterized protein n=1 Tax=Massariosphaeria phaeospora TaxID=100035 RepID=A0A7C8ML38_9PLEO|nr:hypothetical protein BDV95DRAFT_594251 [Massariosphaeria phaeospora]
MEESNVRRTRTRAPVATYNLKILSGASIRRPKRSTEKPRSSDAKAATSEKAPTVISSTLSPSLDPPSPSPTQGRLPELTRTSNDSHEANGQTPREFSTPAIESSYECFRWNGKSHYRSCEELLAAGIWIGYLSWDKHGRSYNKLPSFNQLRANHKNFSPPYPPPTMGSPRDDRQAVCRGCHGPDSQLITLSELSYTNKTKLVIMPLRDEEDDDLFCILLPQPNDRSLPGLRSFRPYETDSVGQDPSSTTPFEWLALRNASQLAGTLETVKAALKTTSVSPVRDRGEKPRNTIIAAPETIPSASIEKQKRSDREDVSAPKRKKAREQSPTPASSDLSESSAGASAPRHEVQPAPPKLSGSHSSSSDLPEDRANRVRFLWTVTVEDFEYEYIRTLGQCPSLPTLLGRLHEDAEGCKEALDILSMAVRWRMAYQLPNGAKRAAVVSADNPVGFERLKELLGESDGWTDATKVDAHLQVL